MESALLESVVRMSRDIRAAAERLSDAEARYLVDTYYQLQDLRIRTDSRIREQRKTDEPHSTLIWLQTQTKTLENQIKGALARYSDGHPVGRWMQSIVGVGPVIAAGLLANIDITRCATVSSIWKFAGLDGPAKKLQKGMVRPYSHAFHVLCAYKLGSSFVNFQNHENDIYGRIYRARKEYETRLNESGAYAEQAARKLKEFKINKNTNAYRWYSEGKLPPAHIHSRARRYAVKLFLAHLHEVWYWHAFGEQAPRPYCFAHLGHTDWIAPPNFDPKTFPLRDPLLPIPRRVLKP